MPVLNKGQWEAPFWGTSKKFISGIDMLGMQNTSIATYARLLPGLTNLTRRIRYYGFYVWLLEQYAINKRKDSVEEFRRFIRRGELLLAFIMAYKYPDEKGVVGSQYASNWLKEYGSKSTIDIAVGADTAREGKSYWQYTSGAFGQYFQGSLIAIGLIAPIEKNKKIFTCTPKFGRKLAEFFGNNIKESTQNRYLDVIDCGTANRDDLEDFSKEFSLIGISSDSKEWGFYIDMLMGKDFPLKEVSAGCGNFRKETILLYMEYLESVISLDEEESFPRSFYSGLWNKKPFADYTACIGWHYYSLNELAHYSMETILWAFLVYLGDQEPIFLNNMVKHFVNNAYKEFKNTITDFKVSNGTSFRSISENLSRKNIFLKSLTEEIKNTREGQPFNGVTMALQILALIFKHDHEQTLKFKSYAKSHNMYRDGEVTDLFEWVEKFQDYNLTEFIEKLLLRHIINRHIEVAMRKMRNRNENSLKFTLEDNILKLVNIVEPVWTSPRIDSMHQFLMDLKLVEGLKLTKLGGQILAENLK